MQQFDNFAQCHYKDSARQAGISTEAKAAKRKMQDDLLNKYCFQSVAIETSSVYGKSSPCFEQLCKETC